MPSRFSYRVSDHRAGRPSCLATQAVSTDSLSAPNFAPNPPPTSGVITRTSSGLRPTRPTSEPFVPCAP